MLECRFQGVGQYVDWLVDWWLRLMRVSIFTGHACNRIDRKDRGRLYGIVDGVLDWFTGEWSDGRATMNIFRSSMTCSCLDSFLKCYQNGSFMSQSLLL